jgi:hypothetical protein
MPRFVIERTFPDDQLIPPTDEHAAACLGNVKAGVGVTWVRSYVSADKRTSFCVYDGPDLDAIQAAATRAGLPIERITQVSVIDPYLDPFFYR